jgi:hypothetical protein
MSHDWDPTFVAIDADREPDWDAAERFAAELTVSQLESWIEEDSHAPVEQANEDTLPSARAALSDLLAEFREAVTNGHQHMVRFWIARRNLYVYVVDDENEFRWTVESVDRSGALEPAGFV